MGRQALRYTGGLIALYIVVAHGTDFGNAFTSLANGGAKLTQTLQGR